MTQKKIHLELLRILAIFLVVFNHTHAVGMPFTAAAEVSFDEFFMICVSLVDKVAVPLFFMISGALLLPKKESVLTLLKHRFVRMLVVLILFVIAQNAFYCFIGLLSPEKAVGNMLYGGTPALVTWFLYAYLAFLLMLPFLRILADKMETQHFLYLIILHFVFVEFFPLSKSPLDAWLPFTASHGNYCNIYIYALIGYYIENRISLSRLSRKVLLMLASASVLSILIGAVLTILPLVMYGEVPSPTKGCFTGAVLIPGIFIYACFRKLNSIRLPMWLTKLISLLGSACFTVMLTENIFRIAIARHTPGYSTHYYTSVLVTFLVCCCGWICGIIAKRIPVIKTLI